MNGNLKIFYNDTNYHICEIVAVGTNVYNTFLINQDH